MITEITSLEQFTAATQIGNAVVKFYAPWCTNCRVMDAVMRPIAAEADAQGVKTFSVNIDTEDGMKIAQTYQVNNLPTVIRLVDGVSIQRCCAANKATLTDLYLGKHED